MGGNVFVHVYVCVYACGHSVGERSRIIWGTKVTSKILPVTCCSTCSLKGPRSNIFLLVFAFKLLKFTECEDEMYHLNFSNGTCIIEVINSKKIASQCTKVYSSFAIPVELQVALGDVCNTKPVRHTMCCTSYIYIFFLLLMLTGDCQFRLTACCICFAHFLCCSADGI